MINKIIIFILIVLLIKYFFYQTKLLDNTFYDYKEIYPELNQLKMHNIGIKQEVINIINDDWKIWPEKNLYKKNNGWKVLPSNRAVSRYLSLRLVTRHSSHPAGNTNHVSESLRFGIGGWMLIDDAEPWK